ncbi:bacillithiol biosynthesis deacetylase BshB1 [Jeotgalibacillus sp. S-D1]|uniref:bacillithiol biosynthesis deacetylase BshB1 n=1 Tax=Jeotgalibacillus sp. S-D1 TaxID=2552189 RepID=UPI001059C4D2|nr:bacillithiol biosynthesis deacetylase BshB1 [Jeotgalibacillus sp. S-D1]TDL35487.1 bacillithiol biosynthesis deacetylase BshB1 [Jeotgalibacillus sp. S-D1]
MTGPVDILAIGAHADDVEIGMGGTIAKWSKKGKKIVICDLTEAELSSNGTVALRKEEAGKAADILGVKNRINLAIPDRGITGTSEQIQAVVELIRALQPKIVFAPYSVDRHPDHGHASSLVKEAVFSSGIHRFGSGKQTAAHKAELFYYMINGIHNPHFVIDTSEVIDDKVACLTAYQSQFNPQAGVSTPLTNGYIETVISRDRVIGKEVNCTFAEGFITDKPLLIEHDLLGE